MFCKWLISLFVGFNLLVPAALAQTNAQERNAQETSAQETAAAAQAALEAREAAEVRIRADMILMSDVAEALSKNLGQLHYLRRLCFGEGNQTWRDYAGQILSYEASGDLDRREALTRAFNAGFFQEQARYQSCSQGVSADAAAISENARRLSTMLGDPYRDH